MSISEDAVPPSGVTGTAPTIPAPARLSPLRVAHRRSASHLLRSALALTSHGAVARRLGVSHQSLERWADPEHAAALTLGDLLAMPAPVTMAVLVGALAQVHANAGEQRPSLAPLPRVLHLASAASRVAGAAASAAEDGVIDERESGELRELIANARLELDAAERDLAQVPR